MAQATRVTTPEAEAVRALAKSRGCVWFRGVLNATGTDTVSAMTAEQHRLILAAAG